MKLIHKIIVLFVALTLGVIANAQEIKARASLDSSLILIGDQVKLKLEIEYPASVNVQFPLTTDSLGNTVEIVNRTKIDTTKIENNKIRLSQEYIITSFDTGYHEINPFLFVVRSGSNTDTVKSNATLLIVFTIPKLDSIMTALKGPIDIKQPFEAPVTLKEVAPLILGVLLALGIAFLIFYYLKQRKNNVPLFKIPQKPKEPAHVIALRKLDKIKEEKIWQQGKTKEYYSEVTDALREYIENRYSISALEQTSEETISAFKAQKELLDEVTFNNLRRILTNADLVKFAKFEPLPDDNNLVLVDAYFFINQTKIEVINDSSSSTDDREGEDVIIK